MTKYIILCSFFVFSISVFAESEIECGGDFEVFKKKVELAALSEHYIAGWAVKSVAQAAEYDQKVIDADRSQGVFKWTFTKFSKRVISDYRLKQGKKRLSKFSKVFQRAEDEFGVPGEVITAFWALETDFGQVQGDYHTVSALMTLAHDCRRPELFLPQVFGAMKLVERGDLDPVTMTGAWAGEIGQVQMLPNDILKYGMDGDDDGKVDLKESAEDAILSAAKMLQAHGWQKNKPWVQEIGIGSKNINRSDIWNNSGLSKTLSLREWQGKGIKISKKYPFPASHGQNASLAAPQGRFGPKFLAFENFQVFLKWNQSFTYTLSAAHLANMLSGVDWYAPGDPAPALSDADTKKLQKKLQDKGYDVGEIDGIIGRGTRGATQAMQNHFGMVPDGWPTKELLEKLD